MKPRFSLLFWCSSALFLLSLLAIGLTWSAFSKDTLGQAASCAIRVDNRLVLVQGTPGKRWALPGGYQQRGESARAAAERETFEETGLRVTARQVLPQDNRRFTLFACQANQPIDVANGRVNMLQAPDLGRESVQAGLFSAQALQSLALRFPAQILQLAPVLDNIPASPSRQLTNFISQADPVHAAELSLMHQWVGQSQAWGKLITLGNFFGETWFYVLCLPLIAWALGRYALQRMVLWLGWLIVATQLGKDLFEQARPFQYLPALSLSGASGFGLPSGHTFCAMFVFGALACWSSARIPLKLGMSLAVVLTLWTAAARVWLGVHFISDVVAGMLLGLGLLALERWQARRDDPQQPLATRRLTWFCLLCASLAVGLFFRDASLMLSLALALGFCLSGCHTEPPRVTALEAIWLLGGLALIMVMVGLGVSLLAIFWQQMLVMLIGFSLISMWLGRGARWSSRLLLHPHIE